MHEEKHMTFDLQRNMLPPSWCESSKQGARSTLPSAGRTRDTPTRPHARTRTHAPSTCNTHSQNVTAKRDTGDLNGETSNELRKQKNEMFVCDLCKRLAFSVLLA